MCLFSKLFFRVNRGESPKPWVLQALFRGRHSGKGIAFGVEYQIWVEMEMAAMPLLLFGCAYHLSLGIKRQSPIQHMPNFLKLTSHFRYAHRLVNWAGNTHKSCALPSKFRCWKPAIYHHLTLTIASIGHPISYSDWEFTPVFNLTRKRCHRQETNLTQFATLNFINK